MKKIITINSEKNKQRFSLTLIFAVIVFAVLICAIGLGTLSIYIFTKVGIIGGDEEISIGTLLLYMLGISVVLGSGISLFLAQYPLRPINALIDHMNLLASGNFKARLKFRSSYANHKLFKEIISSSNKLAEELENTEMLREDFINNFSHEFKTPIVSIAGLAKLVNKGNLTEAERTEYLTAIEEESRRLATMATNVLNLTKVENQSILTDISTFNLSEQIRSCVLLLENKWIEKNTELNINFDEYYIEANEELLKQVWINLVDNAIKFSPYGEEVSISISEALDKYTVAITNVGAEISEENRKKIFNKFYQADESHASEGNGVGLAIVKKIVDLHMGTISVICENGVITFVVTLKKKTLQ